MSLQFYMDENVERSITDGVRFRNIDAVTAQEDGHDATPDNVVLDRAGHLRRIVFTRVEDFLAEATHRQRDGSDFVGVVYCHKLKAGIGECIRNLELIAEAVPFSEVLNQVIYLPL